MSPLPLLLLPDNAAVADDGSLSIAGCAIADLVAEHGTPLFVYDEAHLRSRCREAVQAFGDGVAYATKAFLCLAMARLAHEEGLHLDVATGGELQVALAAGVPADRLVLHGNNKSDEELARALEVGVGRVVIDSFDEIDRIERFVAGGAAPPTVLVRVTPGVHAHTHEYVQTGQHDSKFGFGLADGAAQKAVERAAASPAMDLVGIHAHVGSQIFVADFFAQVVETLADFVVPLELPELSLGGGLGVPYVEGESAPTITEWATTIDHAVAEAGITARVTAEPGRAITAAAAITVYTVGTVKRIEGVGAGSRTYVSVDGGMSDNPRPVLYGSGYETFLPRATTADRPLIAHVVGKHCETGDFIVRDARLPADVAVGDLLSTPVTGAYGHSMGSNYNKVLRPAVVFVADGDARLVVRRETYDDLLRCEVT